MLPLCQIIQHRGLNVHSYAEDTQIYLSFQPETNHITSSITSCLHDLKTFKL